jgi:hypothetical protein
MKFSQPAQIGWRLMDDITRADQAKNPDPAVKKD